MDCFILDCEILVVIFLLLGIIFKSAPKLWILLLPEGKLYKPTPPHTASNKSPWSFLVIWWYQSILVVFGSITKDWKEEDDCDHPSHGGPKDVTKSRRVCDRCHCRSPNPSSSCRSCAAERSLRCSQGLQRRYLWHLPRQYYWSQIHQSGRAGFCCHCRG